MCRFYFRKNIDQKLIIIFPKLKNMPAKSFVGGYRDSCNTFFAQLDINNYYQVIWSCWGQIEHLKLWGYNGTSPKITLIGQRKLKTIGGVSRTESACWSHFIVFFLLFILVFKELKKNPIFGDMAPQSLGCACTSYGGLNFKCQNIKARGHLSPATT